MTISPKEKKYTEAVGRRKTATARVRISPAKEVSVVVNEKPSDTFFKTDTLRNTVREPFAVPGVSPRAVVAQVKGGGVRAQAEAIRHGISRAIIAEEADLRVPLKREGYLKRDPRAKERRKFGLKKARRAPQWSKR